MRGGSFLAVVCVLVLATTSLPVSGWHPVHVPHQPVVFNSNSDFGTRVGGFCVPNVANGVVGGCGTELDPWRIEGWLFVGAPSFGIEIRHTTDHVLIRDNHFLRPAISLKGAEQVNVENNKMEFGTALWVNDGAPDFLTSTKNVRFSGNVVESTAPSIQIRGSLEDVRNIEITGNILTGSTTEAVFLNKVRDVTITGNTISNNEDGLVCGHVACPFNMLIERNLITGNNGVGIKGRWGGPIQDNVLVDNQQGITGCSPAIHGNNLHGNSEWGVKTSHCSADVRNNWWGHATGPSGLGDGSGDAIFHEGSGSVSFSPWLDAPNPDAGP